MVEHPDARRATVRLKNRTVIPNKVPDTSGPVSGFPIEKAKETMSLAIAGLYPRDTFNLITFSGDTHILFPQPVPATPENVRMAREFLASRRGSGGTGMMKAVHAALGGSGEPGRVRMVCFMTDGHVSKDLEILAEVRRHPEARVFAFGVGSWVNRFLLDGMAREGRGEVGYVFLRDDGSAAARRFHERIRDPWLTDITLDFGGLPRRVEVPVEMPDGVSHEGVFGGEGMFMMARFAAPMLLAPMADAPARAKFRQPHDPIRRLIERVRRGAALTAESR